MNIDQFEELKDKLDDQMADVDERAQFFISAGQQEDNDELMDELDALEAEMAEEDFAKTEIGSGAIIGALDNEQKVKPQPAKAAQKQDVDEDEARLAALMM